MSSLAAACGSPSNGATPPDAAGGQNGPLPDAGTRDDAGAPADARPDAPIDAAIDAAPPPVDPPVITSAILDGAPDRQIRQGGRGTLVIEGERLDQLSAAQLGDIAIAIPATASARSIRLPITIPHGQAPGALRLVLSNAAGSTDASDVVEVTPVVVTPAGSDVGRGTFASPLALCRASWDLLGAGDNLVIRDGIHTCDLQLGIPQGVRVTGDSRDGTIVRGTSATSRLGFLALADASGTTSISNLTIENGPRAIELSPRGTLAVSAVDVHNSSIGIIVERGTATVDDYRYTGSRTALALRTDGRIDASHAELHGDVQILNGGTVTIADSEITADFGLLPTSDSGVNRPSIEVIRTRIHSRGIVSNKADLVFRDSTIEARQPTDEVAILASEGAITMIDSSITGFVSFGLIIESSADEAANLSFTRTEITGPQVGISVDSSVPSRPGRARLTMRDSHIAAVTEALELLDGLSQIDLGTADAASTNRLETTSSGGFPLNDLRIAPGVAVDAHGVILNGQTFTGDVVGPVGLPGAYSIGPNTIHF